jgi:prepilin-type processing-associated H-X9-DG protein
MEVVDSSIRWCQPSDVTFEDLVSDKFSWDRTAAHGRVEDCFAHAVPFTNILFADGSIREFGGKPNDEELRQLFSLDGQYPFKKYEGTYRFADAAPPPDKPRIAVFRVWAVCFALVFLFAFLPVAGRRRSLLTNKD